MQESTNDVPSDVCRCELADAWSFDLAGNGRSKIAPTCVKRDRTDTPQRGLLPRAAIDELQ